ncbi:MAG TPA: thylakoid membrane photosystem I accumulation factor [Stenomitos sp.]
MRTGLQQVLFRLQQFWLLAKGWGSLSSLRRSLCTLVATVLLWVTLATNPIYSEPTALASLQDDRFDGNIFALYAGNGSIVPPQIPLADALSNGRPTLLTFYIEDSKDCKQFSTVVSQIQAFYGRAINIIPINVDSIAPGTDTSSTEPGYYYAGKVPQTLIFNAAGEKVLNAIGTANFEQFDDTFRDIFNLLPRSESITLKRRPLNEVNAELAQ